ncbi:MAG: IS4 family transposase [Aggregatilineales bacterium]
MMAFVVSLIWRQIGAVGEAVRVLNQEGLLWVSATPVSQAAVTQRLNSLPAVLFENVLKAVLPKMASQWGSRTRPLPAAVAFVQPRFSQVLVLDGSTLAGLLRKTGLLRDAATNPLAGRIAAVLDGVTRRPVQLWYEPDEQAHDQRFWLSVLSQLVTNCLVLFDSGFLNFDVFDQLTRDQRWFITRPKSNTVYKVTAVLRRSAAVHDYRIELGAVGTACQEPMRLVECLWHGKCYRYLTNVTDPRRLPPEVLLALYAQRWHIEDAFNVVKRLLGLAYFWTGALNGLLVQVWATWVLFAVLVDLTDDVAQTLHLPVQAISMEMVFRGLYHFTQAYQRADALDPVAYFVQHARLLGIVKRKRKIRSPVELLHLTIPILA